MLLLQKLLIILPLVLKYNTTDPHHQWGMRIFKKFNFLDSADNAYYLNQVILVLSDRKLPPLM